MRVVLLGRVSTEDRDQDPENQLRPLRENAARLGWTVAEEIPRKLSAWNDETAEKVWQDCLAPIARGRADALCVWAWDRLSRRGIEDAFAKIGLLERHYGAHFFSLTEPMLSTGSDPRTRELLLSLMAWNAKWESEHRSERLKAAAATKRAHAKAGGGRATWGRGKMPTETDLADIRAMRGMGFSFRYIAKATGFSLGTVHKAVHPVSDEHGDSHAQDAGQK